MSPELNDIIAEYERILVAVLINHPAVVAQVSVVALAVDMQGGRRKLRDAILLWADREPKPEACALMSHLRDAGLLDDVMDVLSASPRPLPKFTEPSASLQDAERGWWETFGEINLARLKVELIVAEQKAERAHSRKRAIEAVLSAIGNVGPVTSHQPGQVRVISDGLALNTRIQVAVARSSGVVWQAISGVNSIAISVTAGGEVSATVKVDRVVLDMLTQDERTALSIIPDAEPASVACGAKDGRNRRHSMRDREFTGDSSHVMRAKQGSA